MSISPFEAAINQICDEKKLSQDVVIQTIEAAMAAAYRKEYGKPKQIIRAKLNMEDLGKTEMFQVYNVVNDDEFEEPENQIKLSDAKKKKKKSKVEDEIIIKLPPKKEFGRIAAQTAKQVIIQRLQEAEREIVFDEFKDKENQLINAVIQQIGPKDIIVNLGTSNAIIPYTEQVQNDRYHIGQRLKVLMVSVEKSTREPRIIVSRSRPELIINLFKMEVPEIASETVKIEGIAREAGVRTKIAVSAHQDGLDPVGSCVGQRGIRIQSILSEIGNEKIDIILYNDDPQKYIINALSPAKIEKVEINKKNKEAKVYVKDDQLSLAIGKFGQNVRLASKLTNYKIDVLKETDKDTKQAENKIEDKKENKKTPKKTPKKSKNKK